MISRRVAILGLLFQGLNLGSLLILMPLVARNTTPNDFGEISLVFAIYLASTCFRSIGSAVPPLFKVHLYACNIRYILRRLNFISVALTALLSTSYIVWSTPTLLLGISCVALSLGLALIFILEGISIYVDRPYMGNAMLAAVNIASTLFLSIAESPTYVDALFSLALATGVVTPPFYTALRGSFNVAVPGRMFLKRLRVVMGDKIEFAALTAIQTQADKIVLAAFAPPTVVGVYFLLSLLPSRITSLYFAVAQALYKRIYIDDDDVTVIYYRATFLIFFAFTAALLVFGSYYLAYLGLSETYMGLPLALVCLSTLPLMCGFIVYPYLARVNLVRLLGRVNLLAVVLLLLLLLLWFQAFSTMTLNVFLGILLVSRFSELIAAYVAERKTGIPLFRSFLIWPLQKNQ